MKCKFLMGIICLMWLTRATAQCPINTVTTNPDNYQNSSDPTESLKFDWRLQTWTGYRPSTPGPIAYQITSPFFDNNGNPNLPDISLVSVKNYSPLDGWEFIARNFGTTLQGTDNPWLILYNRYNGILRIFLQINSSFTSVQAAQLRLSFSSGYNTSGLFSQQGINTLPLNKFNGKALAAVPNQYNNSGMGGNQFFWLYADLPTMYDPCTCNKYSRLNLQAILFSNWEVKLDINGTLQTTGILITNNSASVVNNNGSGFGLDKFLGLAENFLGGVKKFVDGPGSLDAIGQKLMESGNKLIGKKDGIANNFLDQLDGLSGIASGVRGIFSAASTFYSLFEKKNNRPVSQITKTSLVAESKLKATATGSINITSLFGNAYLNNPGSDQSNSGLSANLKTAYNNVLGVFNLTEKPALEYATYRPLTVYYNQELANDPDCIYNGNCQPATPVMAVPITQYKLSGELKYVLNPASGLKINDMKVGLVFPIDKSHVPTAVGDLTPSVNWGNVPAWDALDEDKLNKIGYNIVQKKTQNSLGGAVISTGFVPVTCLDKLSFYIGGAGIPIEDSIGLRVFLELEPINPSPNSSISRVIQVYTFYYSRLEVTGNDQYDYYADAIGWSDNNMDGQPDYNTITSYPWYFQQLGGVSSGVSKWPNTFAGVSTNVKLENTTVTEDILALRDIEIGANVTFGSSPIVLYALGNVINNSGSALPSNVSIVKNVNDACGLLTHSPTDPTTFCSSSTYQSLSAVLRNFENPLIVDKATSDTSFSGFKVGPNPAKDHITVSFALRKAANITIDIYNALGQKQPVSQYLPNKSYQPGNYNIKLPTELWSNGVHFIRLSADGYFEVRKIIVTK
jgi:hypothetical protein